MNRKKLSIQICIDILYIHHDPMIHDKFIIKKKKHKKKHKLNISHNMTELPVFIPFPSTM